MTTKRIGYVDYKLDNFHANVYLKLLRADLKPRGWEVAKCWAMDREGGLKWSAENGVPWVNNVEEMRDCDGIVILAPSNPETHLELARTAFPLGKPTYVDKTFAPDLKTAKKIFALADKQRVPVITSSALRCAASLHKLVAELGKENIRHVRAWGGGRSFEEYAIHPTEMVISVLGPQVRRLMRLTNGRHHQLVIEFSGGRTGNSFVHTDGNCPFQAMVSTDEKTAYVSCAADPIFRDLAVLILDFFESRREVIDRNESLAIAKVLEAASRKRAIGKFVKV